jgi:hypothetical protein
VAVATLSGFLQELEVTKDEARSMRAYSEEHRPLPAGAGYAALERARSLLRGDMSVECGMCGRPKPEQAMVAAEDGLLICDKCNREYKDLEDELDGEELFEDAT